MDRGSKIACRAAARLARGPGRLAAEGGWTLVETLVSALLLVTIGLAVYSSLDGAAASSGKIKTRAIASDLAQADQERMRSFKHPALYRYDETYNRTVAGVTYTVTSHAEWVGDNGSTASCTAGTAGADYIEISSTVRWPRLSGTGTPVVQRSLIAPNAGGLAVQVLNRNGVGVSGAQITTGGAGSFSDFTNSSGCVIFGPIPSGNYSATVTGGCVDRNGVSPVTDTTTVQENTRTTMVLDCDTPGQITASVQTRPYRVSTGTVGAPQADDLRTLSVANSGLAAPFAKVFGNGTVVTSLTATSLFPFTDPYAVYSGDCTGADPGDPRFAVGAGTPPNPAPAEPRITQIVSPGGSHTVVVKEPALNVLVRSGSVGNPAISGARVIAYQKSAGCPATRLDMGTTDSAGQLPKPGVPYGDYDVCAQSGTRSVTITGVKAYDWDAGTALQTFTIPTSGATSSCP